MIDLMLPYSSFSEIPTYDEIVNSDDDQTPHFNLEVNASEDEEELEKHDLFEVKYNFRFEDPDPEFVSTLLLQDCINTMVRYYCDLIFQIKRYPREIESSMRRKDTSRTDKRKEVEERKKQVRARQHGRVQLCPSFQLCCNNVSVCCCRRKPRKWRSCER